MLRNKSILLISPESWDHIFVSKHHYATYLAKRGNTVFFLNPPGSKWSIEETNIPGVFSITYTGFLKGLRFFPRFVQKKSIRNVFDKLQKFSGAAFDIVWSFDNSVFFDFEALPERLLKISHIVDLDQDFQTSSAARSADFCFCTTNFISQKLSQYNSNVFFINHGFNSQFGIEGVKLPGQASIKAVYAGNLAMAYLDWVALSRLVSSNQDVDFIFIGPNAEIKATDSEQTFAKQRTLSMPNSYCVGKQKSSKLAGYYAASDILLISYQERYHRDMANPHKMMDYLGSGKVVVATYTYEFDKFATNHFIAMSKNNDDFIALFGHVKDNLRIWNSFENQEIRRAFALNHAYPKQIERIENIIYKL